MPFEDFDKKIKEAADHHHPAYDEQAWTKMEKLLNKHLPQKDDDRRRILFIILLFLGLGGAGILITRPWKKAGKETIAAIQPVKQDLNPPVAKNDGKEGEQVTNKLQSAEAPNSITPSNPASDKIPVITIEGVPVDTKTYNNKSGPQANSNSKDQSTRVITKPTRNRDVPAENKNPGKPVVDPNKAAQHRSDENATQQQAVIVNPSTKDKKKTGNPDLADPLGKSETKATLKNERGNDEKSIAAKTEIKKEEPVVTKANDKKAKEKNKKVSSFFISFSAGPDMSFVSNNKAGSVKLLTGAGLGYNYKDRLTLRTGFYSASKVYTAAADAYDPPAGFYALYPYLEKVDADCKVYEIPVSLSYNFGGKKNKNFFVSAGLSTFLMNKETYNYHYKYTPTGNTYTNEWTVKNENSHFFSVATLSAGYKKDISKRVSVIAEPYFKIPLGGVGYGKVKLNSGGVLFTVGIKPF